MIPFLLILTVFLDHPDLFMIKELFKENNVTVQIHLKANLNKKDSRYNVSFSVTPHEHVTMTTDNESAVVIIPYNNSYNVTVLGTVVMCGYTGVLSSDMSLFYGEK